MHPLTEPPHSKRNKILVVDDSPDQSNLICHFLAQAGFEVQIAENGEEGILKVREWVPDLVISDVAMPMMDGFELSRRIKSDNRLKHIPVILLSALWEVENLVNGLEAGADFYFLKPCDIDFLISAIREILGREEGAASSASSPGLKINLESLPYFPREDQNKVLRYLLSSYDRAARQSNRFLNGQAEFQAMNEGLRLPIQETKGRLSSSRNRFQSILNDVRDTIVIIDEGQHIILFNKAAEDVFGYRAEEVLGMPLNILLPERFRPGHREWVRTFGEEQVERRSMNERRDVWGKRKNGEEFPAEITISKFEEDGALYFSAILREVTDRKAAEKSR